MSERRGGGDSRVPKTKNKRVISQSVSQSLSRSITLRSRRFRSRSFCRRATVVLVASKKATLGERGGRGFCVVSVGVCGNNVKALGSQDGSGGQPKKLTLPTCVHPQIHLTYKTINLSSFPNPPLRIRSSRCEFTGARPPPLSRATRRPHRAPRPPWTPAPWPPFQGVLCVGNGGVGDFGRVGLGVVLS